MAFTLSTAKTLSVPVTGAFAGESGKPPVKFNLTLLCHRLNQTQIDAMLENKAETLDEFLHKIVYDWADVLTDEGEKIPFTQQSLDEALEQPGMRALFYSAYMNEISAKARN